MFFSVFLHSQTTLKGTISNVKKRVLDNITIVIEDNNKNILAYSITNSKGFYTLKVKTSLDSLLLKVSSLGYKKIAKQIVNKTQTLNFVIEESKIELEEVVIKRKPITYKKDTLNYLVSAFKSKKDQVIADVLRKMPGIEIQPNGQILYQGKPIQKYYIEGLDLLEGRYNLANNNIPANEVSKVQILENHQPIRLLDSLVFSDKASLNIKLKNKNVLIGTAKIGAGLSPFLWESNSSPMLFSKKQQFLASYQTNNTGKDVANDLSVLTYEQYLSQIKKNYKDKNWISIMPVSVPSFKKEKWLDNKIHMLSGNYLRKFKNNLELKINTSYFSDYQSQVGTTKTTIFTDQDTIHVSEVKKNTIKLQNFRSSFVLEKNTKKEYFKNTLSVELKKQKEEGMLFNGNNLTQQTSLPDFVIDNSLKWLFPYKNKVITFYSDILFKESNQNLLITPGQFPLLLYNEINYETTEQDVNNSFFYTRNYISFIKSFKKFTYSSKVGFELNKEKLKSNILIDKNLQLLNNEFSNNITYSQNSIFIQNQIKFQNKLFKATIDLPLKWVDFFQKDINDKNLQELILEPKIVLVKDFNAFWKTSLSFHSEKTFGSLEEIYSNYIIKNYRNINRYNSRIRETRKSNYNFLLSYKNPLNGFFLYSFFMFSDSKSNIMLRYDYEPNGQVIINSVDIENNNVSKSITLKLGKFISDLETTVSFSSGFIFSKRNNYFGNSLSKINSETFRFNLEIDSDITNWLNVNLLSKYNKYNTNSKSIVESNFIETYTNSLDFNFYLNEQTFLSIHNDSFFNSRNKNLDTFLNVSLNYKAKKVTYNLHWNNILNNKSYTNIFISNTSIINTNYVMRPSQVLFSTKFRF